MIRLVNWFKERLPGWRRYWSQRGVVPRWQYLLVYVLIVSAGVFGQFKTSRIANTANRAVIEIQRSRIDVARTQCRQQNERNRAAYLFLHELPADPKEPLRTPQEREALLRGFTDALVGPRQNCQLLIKHRFGSVR
jgi:hypothetical protein